MNIKKIESDFLRGLFSKESNNYCMIEYGGRIGYSDGYFIALVRRDVAFVKCNRPPIRGDTIIKDIFDKGIAKYGYTLTTKHANLARYERKDGVAHAYIDVKYTKYFDRDASYHVKDCRSPVYVYEDDIFVGMILPVYIKEE